MAPARPGAHDHCMRPQPAGRDERQAMSTPDLRWQLAATGASRAPLQRNSSPWRRALAALPAPAWAAAVAVALALLLVFQQVVAGIVVQGELRRAGAATQVDRGSRPSSALAPLRKPVKSTRRSE
jgi:hypothetical protein